MEDKSSRKLSGSSNHDFEVINMEDIPFSEKKKKNAKKESKYNENYVKLSFYQKSSGVPEIQVSSPEKELTAQVPITFTDIKGSQAGIIAITNFRLIINFSNLQKSFFLYYFYKISAEKVADLSLYNLHFETKDFYKFTVSFSSQNIVFAKKLEETTTITETFDTTRIATEYFKLKELPLPGFYEDLLVKEYKRVIGTDSNFIISKANKTFAICSTYPKYLVIPKNFDETNLTKLAKFRSKCRIPGFLLISSHILLQHF